MKTNKFNNKSTLVISTKILILLTAFSVNSMQNLSAETVPSFPAPTMVDSKKESSYISPLATAENNNALNDPKALNAIRTLIQGGIPVGQSKTQIMNDVTPISQYSGSSTMKINFEAGSSYRYLVKKGDTLNNIIKATFNQHPLKMQMIRKAIIDNNKKAFPTGKPNSMQAGATIIIPSVAAINGMVNEGVEVPAMTPKPNPYVSTDPHRGWVRFP